MTRRRHRIAAVAAALLACCLAFSLWMIARYRDASASRAVSSVALVPRQPGHAPPPGRPHDRPSMLSVDTPLAACERRIEQQTDRLPTVAIVGASYTAGTGPDNPELSWAVGLARLLHWNAVIYGVPGAGFVRTGSSGRGPVAHMLNQEGLHNLGPSLVIVQAGHDDFGVSSGLEERRVRAAVDLIHAAAPRARVGLLTTFALTPYGTPALREADHVIVTAGTAADSRVIIMDPLAGGWTFPRAIGNRLHPTAAGDQWIARTIAAILGEHGVRPAPATSTTPVICDVSVGAGKPVSATA